MRASRSCSVVVYSVCRNTRNCLFVTQTQAQIIIKNSLRHNQMVQTLCIVFYYIRFCLTIGCHPLNSRARIPKSNRIDYNSRLDVDHRRRAPHRRIVLMSHYYYFRKFFAHTRGAIVCRMFRVISGYCVWLYCFMVFFFWENSKPMLSKSPD